MAWVLIVFQAMLGLFDGYVFMPSKIPTFRLLSLLLIDIPSVLIIVYSVEPFGPTMTVVQVAAASGARMLMWFSYSRDKYNRVL